MKKYFILAIAVVAATTACSKNEIDLSSVPTKKVAFEVANYASQTKANASLTNAEDSLYQFHSYAYQFPKIGDAVEFMNTDIFAWDNSTPAAKVTEGHNIYFWAPEDDYYWPKTGFINFYSYAGTQAPAASISADKKTIDFAYNNVTIAANDNLMVADAALHFNSNQSNYQVDGTEGSAHVTTGVPTLFRHLLSKLYIDVKLQIPAAKQSANTSWKVIVLDEKDIDGDSAIADGEKSLIIPVNQGTLTLQNIDSLATDAALNTTTQLWARTQTGTDVVSGWKPAASTENIQLSQADTLTLEVNSLESTSVEQLLDWRTVMPQLTDNIAFQLIYKVQGFHGSTKFMEEIRTVGITVNGDNAENIHNLTGSIASWESNKKITYHIIIDPATDKVTFDPAVEAYDEVEANASDVINIDNNGIVTP